MNLLFNATTIPSALMFAALNEQDLLCRVFGDCRAGDPLDREIGDLWAAPARSRASQKLFTYVRYNAELTREGLDALGCQKIEPETCRSSIPSTASRSSAKVGKAVAKEKVREAHFAGFPPVS